MKRILAMFTMLGMLLAFMPTAVASDYDTPPPCDSMIQADVMDLDNDLPNTPVPVVAESSKEKSSTPFYRLLDGKYQGYVMREVPQWVGGVLVPPV